MSSAVPEPVRLDIGVVGAGRVGSVLGAALRAAGHRVTAVSAVSEASLARAAALLPGVPVRTVPEVVSGAMLVLFAVPDDALVPLVSGLAATGSLRDGQILVHTSGAHGTAPFEAALAQVEYASDGPRGIVPLALHPAMTFTGTAMDLDRLRDCCFGVTSAPTARPLAEALVLEMGGDPVWVEEEDRPIYHAALAHGSNHLVTLVAQAVAVLRAADVSDPARLLEPLLSAALSNALRSGDDALTGPVSRGDAGTIRTHLSVLSESRVVAGQPDIPTTYAALARATTQRAVRSGRLRSADAALVLDVLDEYRRDHPAPDTHHP